MGWERLNPKSQALAEGLRRLKSELMPINPRIAETRGEPTHYTEGKWKNYNTVLKVRFTMWLYIAMDMSFIFGLRTKQKKEKKD